MKKARVLSASFYIWRNWGSERWINLKSHSYHHKPSLFILLDNYMLLSVSWQSRKKSQAVKRSLALERETSPSFTIPWVTWPAQFSLVWNGYRAPHPQPPGWEPSGSTNVKLLHIPGIRQMLAPSSRDNQISFFHKNVSFEFSCQ